MTDLEIRIDPKAITFGDLLALESAEKGNMSFRDMTAILDRVVLGGVKGLPIDAFPAIVTALKAAIEGTFATAPESPGGN